MKNLKIIIAIVIGKISDNSSGDNLVSVPNFINMTISQAREQYGDIFQFQTKEEYNSDYEEGVIFKQGTDVNANAQKGDTIVLTVSKGPRMQPVPDVSNLPYEDAVAELKKYGFESVRLTSLSDDVLVGYVIKTEPAASVEAPYGSSVNVIVCEGEIVNKVHTLNLDDKVIFTGVKQNAYDYYNVMDVFVLPSLYEGLPVVGVEAQANGLPIVTSDTVTRDLNIAGGVDYLSFGETASFWANHIVHLDTQIDRGKYFYKIKNSAFDIKSEAKKLEDKYLTILED